MIVVVFGALCAFGLGYAVWLAFSAGGARLRWLVAAALIVAGVACMCLMANDKGGTSGEMPPEFAVGVWMLMAGLGCVFVRVCRDVVRRLSGRRSRS